MTGNYKDNNELTDEEIEQACGILQAPKYVGWGEQSEPQRF